MGAGLTKQPQTAALPPASLAGWRTPKKSPPPRWKKHHGRSHIGYAAPPLPSKTPWGGASASTPERTRPDMMQQEDAQRHPCRSHARPKRPSTPQTEAQVILAIFWEKKVKAPSAKLCHHTDDDTKTAFVAAFAKSPTKAIAPTGRQRRITPTGAATRWPQTRHALVPKFEPHAIVLEWPTLACLGRRLVPPAQLRMSIRGQRGPNSPKSQPTTFAARVNSLTERARASARGGPKPVYAHSPSSKLAKLHPGQTKEAPRVTLQNLGQKPKLHSNHRPKPPKGANEHHAPTKTTQPQN